MYEFYITPQEYFIAEQNGICKETLESRIRIYCWEKEKAITQPLQIQKRYGDWTKVAKANGLSYSTFHARISKLGWTPEKAATYPHQDRATIAELARESRRIIPKDLIKRAEENGISHHTLYQRIINRGWDIERAIAQPLAKQGRPRKVS